MTISIDDLLKENQGLKEKIAENNFKIKDSRQKLDHIRSGYERDEGLALLIISLVGCLVTPLGILIAPIVLKRNKVTNTFHRGVIVTSIVCMLINFWFSQHCFWLGSNHHCRIFRITNT